MRNRIGVFKPTFASQFRIKLYCAIFVKHADAIPNID